jgi:catechol 2,3-dioxygenase-like lactoylglutathione lyase family enzyme
MTSIDHLALQVADVPAAEEFYDAAFGLGDRLRVAASDAPTSGFRGFTVSLVVSQPATVTGFVEAAIDAGATALKPAADVPATKRFYEERGFAVAKSFLGRYVEFECSPGAVKLALYRRRALAKDAGVDAEGGGSHRLLIGSDAGPCTDPDGFEWEAVTASAPR